MIANDLKSWRTAHSLSQSQLAMALGVSVRTIQEWEQGRKPGPPGNIMTLALAGLDTMIAPPRPGPLEVE